MNDDWDGGDWAQHFSGPSDYEIERQQESDYQSSQSSEDYEGEYIDVLRIQFREKDKNTFDSFIAASAYAQKKAAEIEQTLRVRAIRYGWEVIEDRLTSADILSECEDYIKDDGYFTAIELIDALRNKVHELALQLLKKPINVNVMDGQNVSALMIAAYRGYADICEKLLSLGAVFQTGISMDARDDEQKCDTVLHRAKLSRDKRTIEVIGTAYVVAEWSYLKAVASEPFDFQFYGYPRLVEAARLGQTSLCVEMVRAGVPIDPCYSYGDAAEYDDTPVSAAIYGGHMSTGFVLVALGADISALKNHDNYSEEFESSLVVVRKFFDSLSTTGIDA